MTKQFCVDLFIALDRCFIHLDTTQQKNNTADKKNKQPNGSESILLPVSICTRGGNECIWVNNDTKQTDDICNEGISF